MVRDHPIVLQMAGADAAYQQSMDKINSFRANTKRSVFEEFSSILGGDLGDVRAALQLEELFPPIEVMTNR